MKPIVIILGLVTLVVGAVWILTSERQLTSVSDANVDRLENIQNDIWQWYDLDEYSPVAIRRIEYEWHRPLQRAERAYQLVYSARPTNSKPLLDHWDDFESVSEIETVSEPDRSLFPDWWKPQKRIRRFMIGREEQDVYLTRTGAEILVLFTKSPYHGTL